MRVIDRTGERYGRLVAVERLPAKSKTDTNARWFCRCDCGQSTVSYGQDLARGRTKSCGCLNREQHLQHGMAGTHVYAVWQMMLQRCENPNSQAYENYGARGIKVCPEWHRFEQFFADMGNRRSGFSLDRINNDGDYCKENCRWAVTSQQLNNTRRNRVLELNGEKLTIAQWAERKGFKWTTIRTRLDQYGWSVEKALTTPPMLAESFKFKGRKQTLREWSDETGINIEVLRSRVRKMGWSISRALTEPIRFKSHKET